MAASRIRGDIFGGQAQLCWRCRTEKGIQDMGREYSFRLGWAGLDGFNWVLDQLLSCFSFVCHLYAKVYQTSHQWMI